MEVSFWNLWGAFLVASLILWLGVFCTLLPVLPGTMIAWLGVLVHRLWLGGSASVPWWFVALGLGLVIFAQLVDYLAVLWGARKFGTSWKGGLGAVVGALVGVFFGLPGLLIGPIVGAVLFEWIELRDKSRAMNAGIGTMLGGLAAIFLKLLMTVAYAGAFYFFLPFMPWNRAG